MVSPKRLLLIGGVLAVVILCYSTYRWWTFEPVTALLRAPGIPVASQSAHVRSDAPTASLPDKEVRGKLTTKIRIPDLPKDSAGERPEVTIQVVVPKDDGPPIVLVDGDTSDIKVEATWQDYRDPFFAWRFHLLAGGSLDLIGGLSPYGALTILTIGERVHVGVGADRFGLGPAAHVEFWREFNLGVRYSLFDFRPDINRVSIALAYRF